MPIISIFSGTFCKEGTIAKKVADRTGFRQISDKDIVTEAAKQYGMDQNKLMRTFSAKTSVFNKFTHEKERSIAQLRYVLARMISSDNLVIKGFVGHLIPECLTHVLRVCLIADMKSRISLACRKKGINEKAAINLIHSQDENCRSWVESQFKIDDPWDESLYDMVIPIDKMENDDAVNLIKKNVQKDVLKPTERSKKALADFILSATVELALAREGHNMRVNSIDGRVILTIDKQVLMLSRLEEELTSIAVKIEGVKSVETKVEKKPYQTDSYRKYDFKKPSRVLLVDDEREFVQTLSERLLIRDIGSAVAYDGKSALDLVQEDEPEVMILDLKMPGIDGIEVLRRVKETRPGIEVVILTGHGSEVDEETCMKLGAFAYLNKPVDIDLLSKILKKANEKIQGKKAVKSQLPPLKGVA
jgi:two-component system, OmpR family, response regulator CpxR